MIEGNCANFAIGADINEAPELILYGCKILCLPVRENLPSSFPFETTALREKSTEKFHRVLDPIHNYFLKYSSVPLTVKKNE